MKDPALPGDAGRRSVRWWSPEAVRLHATLAVGLAGCAVASVIEWGRALSGHEIAWVYAFEWPLFAVAGTWTWWRLLRGDSPTRRTRRPGPASRRTPRPVPDPAHDEQLAAWQAYLARLHAADPPGGPPERQPGIS
jgi:hypothetical protein